MGTSAPVRRVVQEPRRHGNPFIAVPATPVPSTVPAEPAAPAR